MKLKALVVLAATLVAGCGGGDDSDDNAGNGNGNDQPVVEQPAEKTDGDDKAAVPQKLTGARNEKNVMKALGLEKEGDAYTFSGGPCRVNAFVVNEAGVKKLKSDAAAPANVIANDSGNTAVELDKLEYFCAIQAANRLKNVP